MCSHLLSYIVLTGRCLDVRVLYLLIFVQFPMPFKFKGCPFRSPQALIIGGRIQNKCKFLCRNGNDSETLGVHLSIHAP